MKQFNKNLIISILCFVCASVTLNGQVTVQGSIVDAETGEDLIGAAIVLTDGSGGAITDYEGVFLLKVPALPVVIRVSYTGYDDQEITVSDAAVRLKIKLKTNSILIEDTVIRGQRIDDKQKAAPLTVENLDAIAIKETPAVRFFNGRGNQKGVGLTTPALGF